jgi:protease IV
MMATFLAMVIFSVLAVIFFFVVVVGGIVGSINNLSEEKPIALTESSVLHLKLDGEITELQQDNPFEGLPIPGTSSVPNIGLLQLKQAIHHAKTDDKIKGIYLDVSWPGAGFSTIEEIRASLLDFRESGKWVVAYNTTFSEGAYYLSSAADDVFMYKDGDVEFNGLTISVSFFKRLFDRWEIKPQVFRVGEFKSAVEPFILEQMSPENEEQLSALANSIYDKMLSNIALAREVSKEKLEEYSDNMVVRNAAIAKELNLVDGLLYEDEFLDTLRNRLDLAKEEKINFITYSKYRKTFSDYKNTENEIAVIVAEGTIMPGEGDAQDQLIGADSFIKELRNAVKNDKVKAIVVRINSPGGEFRASDMMWREIQLARKKKPVIASMSDYAASGGYYMAMGCDTIVAQANTITGSIGIFGMMFDMSGFLGNKIGITFDEVRTGNFGDMYTVSRPLTEAERNYWQKNLDEHYDTFITKAAEGRGMAKEDIAKVASGRVWTGNQALGNKLVDVEGGFNDAIRIAAEKAKLGDDYRVKYFPKQKTFFETWMEEKEEIATEAALRNELGEYYQYYNQLQKLKTFQGVQARMPFEIKMQ